VGVAQPDKKTATRNPAVATHKTFLVVFIIFSVLICLFAALAGFGCYNKNRTVGKPYYHTTSNEKPFRYSASGIFRIMGWSGDWNRHSPELMNWQPELLK
jgi:hypothetical protein